MTSQGQTFLKQVPVDALNGDAWRAMIHFAEQSSMWATDEESWMWNICCPTLNACHTKAMTI